MSPTSCNSPQHRPSHDHPLGEAWQCPDCGDQSVILGWARETDAAPRVVAKLPPDVWTLEIWRPTDAHGSWMVKVLDKDHNELQQYQQQSLLAVALMFFKDVGLSDIDDTPR